MIYIYIFFIYIFFIFIYILYFLDIGEYIILKKYIQNTQNDMKDT